MPPNFAATPTFCLRKTGLTSYQNLAPVAVLGTGLAGLIAALQLRQAGVPVVLYEATSRIAGLAATFHDPDGFTYDFGAHFITNRFAKEIGVRSQCRDVHYYGETVLLRGRTYSYPFGLVANPRFALGALRARLSSMRGVELDSVAQAFSQAYGKRIANEIAIPLVEAWSGEPATKLSPAVMNKIPSNLAHVLLLKLASKFSRRAIAIGYGKEKPSSVLVWHVYPEGGLGSLCQHLAGQLVDAIRLESPVEEIVVESDEVVAVRSRGRYEKVSVVISTAPVNRLPGLIRGSTALDHLAKFRYRAMLFVNMRFRGRGLLPDVVLWTPEPHLPFFRLTEATLSMPWLAPEGKTLITVDIGCTVGDRFWTMNDAAAGEYCLDAMESIIPGARQSYLGCRVLRTAIAYPVFLREYEDERLRFQRTTGIRGLYSIGRNGEFDHLLTEDVYWRTLRKMPEVLTFLRYHAESRSTQAIA